MATNRIETLDPALIRPGEYISAVNFVDADWVKRFSRNVRMK